MAWLKYCKRISKETNIGFIVTWVISPMYDLFINGLWDWVTFVGYTLCMITVYFSMILTIKTSVWDKIVKQQINDIIEKQYNGYRGDKYKALQRAHTYLRKDIGDENFLTYLQEQQKRNPKPEYNY